MAANFQDRFENLLAIATDVQLEAMAESINFQLRLARKRAKQSSGAPGSSSEAGTRAKRAAPEQNSEFKRLDTGDPVASFRMDFEKGGKTE